MSENARIAEVDVLRGLLAITVVLGHAIQQYEMVIGGFWLAVKDFIYSFHMPAFVFVSGFCASRLCDPSYVGADFVKTRAKRMIVPYLTWGVLYFILRILAGGYARISYDYDKLGFFLLGYNPDGAMWFVWALFAATIAVAFGLKVVDRAWLLAVTCLLAVIAPYFCPSPSGHTRALLSIPMYMFIFLLGVSSRGWLMRCDPIARACGCRFLLCCATLFAVAYSLHVTCFLCPAPWYLVTSVSATFFLYGLSCVVAEKCRCMQSVLAFLGVEAMSIYVLGEPIKVMCRIAFVKAGIPLVVAFPVMLACMFVLPITLARIIRRSVVLRQLLLGEFKTR